MTADTEHSTGEGGTLADGNTVAALLAKAAALGVPGLDAQLLLARATGLARAVLIAFGERIVEPAAAAQFLSEAARRAGGEPLAYIEGGKEFWSLRLAVTPCVLIPRPETELLVERALARVPAVRGSIADLGTGSGAIALAIARERPQCQVLATDASADALQIARQNAQTLGLGNLRFAQGSWCDALGGQQWDAIVSNPPYIDAGDPALALLQHEPRTALVAGAEGYADLLQIIHGAPAHLRPGGWLLLEHGASQAKILERALVARGYARVVCHRDLAGHDRVTEAQWP